jgi:hypothetical protein
MKNEENSMGRKPKKNVINLMSIRKIILPQQ